MPYSDASLVTRLSSCIPNVSQKNNAPLTEKHRVYFSKSYAFALFEHELCKYLAMATLMFQYKVVLSVTVWDVCTSAFKVPLAMQCNLVNLSISLRY